MRYGELVSSLSGCFGSLSVSVTEGFDIVLSATPTRACKNIFVNKSGAFSGAQADSYVDKITVYLNTAAVTLNQTDLENFLAQYASG